MDNQKFNAAHHNLLDQVNKLNELVEYLMKIQDSSLVNTEEGYSVVTKDDSGKEYLVISK